MRADDMEETAPQGRKAGFGLMEAIVALLAGVLLLGALLNGLMHFQRHGRRVVVGPDGELWPVAPSAAVAGMAAALQGSLARLSASGAVAAFPTLGGRAARWGGEVGAEVETGEGLAGLLGALEAGLVRSEGGGGELLWLEERQGGTMRVAGRLRLGWEERDGWSLETVRLERAEERTLEYRLARRAGGVGRAGVHRVGRRTLAGTGVPVTAPVVVVFPDPRASPVGAGGGESPGSGYVQAYEALVFP